MNDANPSTPTPPPRRSWLSLILFTLLGVALVVSFIYLQQLDRRLNAQLLQVKQAQQQNTRHLSKLNQHQETFEQNWSQRLSNLELQVSHAQASLETVTQQPLQRVTLRDVLMAVRLSVLKVELYLSVPQQQLQAAQQSLTWGLRALAPFNEHDAIHSLIADIQALQQSLVPPPDPDTFARDLATLQPLLQPAPTASQASVLAKLKSYLNWQPMLDRLRAWLRGLISVSYSNPATAARTAPPVDYAQLERAYRHQQWLQLARILQALKVNPPSGLVTKDIATLQTQLSALLLQIPQYDVSSLTQVIEKIDAQLTALEPGATP